MTDIDGLYKSPMSCGVRISGLASSVVVVSDSPATNGNSFSPNGNKIIRLNINSGNLADFTHSYMQATLVNTSTRNLALDTGIPWISRMQILSGGQELESCDAYNRLHSMLQAVQGNPAPHLQTRTNRGGGR
eukprot:SAG22_NODE_86_length_21440_cov_288.248700_6_plen_132_part_00